MGERSSRKAPRPKSWTTRRPIERARSCVGSGDGGSNATMDIYERLGVTKRVNGAGLLTRLGGSLMAPEVIDAMRDAAGSFVDMAELQTRASTIIARYTG